MVCERQNATGSAFSRVTPSAPRSGSCECLVDLLMYLCGAEDDPGGLADWVLDWLAYPLQNPGAKMQTALLVHGPGALGQFEPAAEQYEKVAAADRAHRGGDHRAANEW